MTNTGSAIKLRFPLLEKCIYGVTIYRIKLEPLVKYLRDFLHSFGMKVLLGCLLFMNITSQGQDLLGDSGFSNGKPFIYRMDKTQTQLQRNQSSITSFFQLSTSDLILVGTTHNRYGFEINKYQQNHKGIPVEHGRVSATSKNGRLVSIAGELYNVPSHVNTVASIMESEALEAAMRHVKAKRYKWDIESEGTNLPEGKLVFINTRDRDGTRNAEEVVLAYKFDIYAVEPLVRTLVYVDANSGFVIFENPIIKHAVPGEAHTRYSGQRTISTTLDNGLGKYVLKDDSRGNGIHTFNMHKGENYGAATQFTDSDNAWTEFDNVAKDNAALDAHWGATITYDYFLQEHGRNSYDGNGARLRSYVHYSIGYVNAFWDGLVMTYGDGDTSVDPLTSLDICAHEIAHAVCSSTADLIYAYEPGALNESLSDIWAANIENFAASGKNTWEIGEDINLVLRSMSDPNQHQHPDTYQGDHWYFGYEDHGGVHINSGVMNHWYYILVMGKEGTNDHGIDYHVQGLGFEAAASIVYHMETAYLTANSQYNDARTASLQSAADIFGEASHEFIQTRKAWDAVGVYDVDAAPSQLVASPVSNNVVQLHWADNSDSELSFVIERSASPDSEFLMIAEVDENVTAYSDVDILPGIYYYRVRAKMDGYATACSNVMAAELQTTALIMASGEITTCDRVFLDPGGFSNYGQENDIIMIVRPAQAGTKVSISFSAFNLVNGDNLLYPGDWLEVFDGEGVSARKVGNFTDRTLPPQINATNTSGALTFRFRSDFDSEYHGWHATLSCINVPSDLVTSVTGTQVSLAWQDNNLNEAGYSVERKLVGNTSYEEVASLPPNVTSYVDTMVSPDNLYGYRVRVRNGYPTYEGYSNVAIAVVGREPFVMRDGSRTVCDVPFMDTGGNGPYNVAAFGDGYSSTTSTISPSVPGKKVSIRFSEFDLEEYDWLVVYDGGSTDAPVIGEFSGLTIPPRITASNPEGKLTMEFFTDYSVAHEGWLGEITCVELPMAPTNLQTELLADSQVRLSWTSNGQDDIFYIVERATAGLFEVIATLEGSLSTYIDSDVKSERKYTYRVRAERDEIFSPYTSTSSVTIGNEPVLMRNGVTTACGKVFLDKGADGPYGSNENFILTFNPDFPGNRVKINFAMFDLNGADKMIVYDGANSLSPIIGTFRNHTIPPELVATSDGGQLTVEFSSDYYSFGVGWEAVVSCVAPPLAPNNVHAVTEGEEINITWQDNSDDETGFIIERATGKYFVPLATVGPNVEFFSDEDFPENRKVSYRIRARGEIVFSDPSDTASVTTGIEPIIMHTGAITTCNAQFLDPGGDENYGRENHTLTISPGEPGKRVVIAFSNIDLVKNEDVLAVYNGPFVDPNDRLWQWNNDPLQPETPLSVQAANQQGQLTVRFFTAPHGERRSGWVATISCVDKSAPTITFPDRIKTYVHPDDGDEIFVEAFAHYPRGEAFSYSLVDDGSSTGEVELINQFGGVWVKVIRTGTVKIKASIEENNYFLAGEKTMTLTILKGTRRINFSLPSVVVGQASQLTASIGNFGSTRPDDFTFETVTNPSYKGEVILSGEGNSIMTAAKAGSFQVKAVLAETDLYLGDEEIRGATIHKATPVISFADFSVAIGHAPLDLNATAYPGANFTYCLTGNNAGLVNLSGAGNSTLTAILPGTLTIKAMLPETETHIAAEKTITVTVISGSGTTPQSITFDPLPARTYGAPGGLLTAVASSSLPVFYVSSNPFVASVFGNMLAIHSAGTVTITAMQPGNSTFAAAPPVTQVLVVSRKIVLARLQDATRFFGEPNPAFVINYTGFIFGDDENDLDVKPFAYSPATITNSPGEYPIQLESLGSDVNYEILQQSGTLTITKADQSIEFGALENKNIYSEPFAISTRATSGLPVDLAVVSGPALVSGNFVSLTGEAGVVEILATQPGNNNYNAADPVLRIFEVHEPIGTPQTITFTQLPEKIYGDEPFQLIATASSDLPVTFTLSSGNAVSLSGDMITILTTGSVTITARQSGDQLFATAPPVQRTLTIHKKPLQAIIIDVSRPYGSENPPFVIAYSGFVNSEKQEVLDIEPSGPFTLANHDSAPGAYAISFENHGEDNNYEIVHTEGTLTITKASQSIAFSPIEDRVTGADPFTIEASASSGLPVNFSVVSGPATISDAGITLTGETGTVTVEASQQGDSNYFPAETVIRTFHVVAPGAAPQVISFNELAPVTYGDDDFALLATASSGLQVVFTSANEDIVSVSGSVVTIHGAGSAIITASQPGDETFTAAPDVQQTLIVQKKDLFIRLENAKREYGDPNPEFTYDYEGFVYNETEGDLDVKPSAMFTQATEDSDAGVYPISFASPGSDSNYSLHHGDGTLTVTKKQQQITFESVHDVLTTTLSFTLQASATSGLPVAYDILSGPATVSGEVISLLGQPGLVEVEASQEGNHNYFPAKATIQSFAVLSEDIPTNTELPVVASIDLWPNPASSGVVVSCEGNMMTGITLLDVVGRSKSFEINLKNEYYMDLTKNSKGIYILAIHLGNGITVMKRLVIK